jgi:AraC-like DNA-binding protein
MNNPLAGIKLRTEQVFRMGTRLTCGFTYIPLSKERRTMDITDRDYTLVYLLKGVGRYIDSQGKETEIRSGNVFHRFPAKRHSVIFYPEEDLFETYMVVPREIFEVLKASKNISLERPVFNLGIHRDIVERFESMLVELREQSSNRLCVTIARMHAFICDLLLMELQPKSGRENIMAKACAILGENLDKKISLPEIAKRLNMSYSNFRRLFEEYAGEPPGEYRIRRRIEQIQEKLVSGKQSIKETAAEMGYPDIYSFSKQFKKYTGIAPRSFLKKN